MGLIVSRERLVPTEIFVVNVERFSSCVNIRRAVRLRSSG